MSRFAITTQVLNEKEWMPAVVQKRQAALLDILKEVWRLSPANNVSQPESNNWYYTRDGKMSIADLLLLN